MYHARIAAVGTEADMRRLCQSMLLNAGYAEDMPGSLDALAEAVRRFSAEEAGPDCGFLYEMVTRRAYGSAEEDTCRFRLRREPCGLWTALLSYQSASPFQPEDWLRLHHQCDRLPMLILRACDDFDRDKGLLVLSGGYMQEDWSRMAECWLWLVTRYGETDPEEAVRQLIRLQRLLEDEEEDLTVGELLHRCAELLQRLHDRTQDADALRLHIAEAVQHRDYQTLFTLQCTVAQTALWETDRLDWQLSCLDTLMKRFSS